jgi:hypothetical protein
MTQNRNGKKIKVCIVTISLSKGGAERSTALLSRMLSAENFDVFLVTLNDVIDYRYSGELINLGKNKHKEDPITSRLYRFIEFRNIGDKLTLSCKGDFCHQETILGSEKSQSITIKKTSEDQEIIQGIFSLKYLSIFTKCTNLSSNVEIYLKNNYPIILRYTIASLGEIKLCLSQQDIS